MTYKKSRLGFVASTSVLCAFFFVSNAYSQEANEVSDENEVAAAVDNSDEAQYSAQMKTRKSQTENKTTEQMNDTQERKERIQQPVAREIEDVEVRTEPTRKKVEAKKIETRKESGSQGQGFLRIGPTVSLGVPNFFDVGIEARFFGWLGLSVNAGGLPSINLMNLPGVPLKKDDGIRKDTEVYAKAKHIEARLVLYPFSGSFFIGSAIGQRNIDLDGKATFEDTILGVTYSGPVSATLKTKTTYVTPQFGWMGLWDSGFMIATEFGVQIPLSKGTADFNVDLSQLNPIARARVETSDEYKDMVKQISEDYSKNLTQDMLPYWNIIKLGWLF